MNERERERRRKTRESRGDGMEFASIFSTACQETHILLKYVGFLDVCVYCFMCVCVCVCIFSPPPNLSFSLMCQVPSCVSVHVCVCFLNQRARGEGGVRRKRRPNWRERQTKFGL